MEERVWVPNNQFQAVSLKGGLSRTLASFSRKKKKKNAVDFLSPVCFFVLLTEI